VTRIMQRCDQLGAISDSPTGVTRLYLSPAYKEGLKLVESWMQEAGMNAWMDESGNQWGRYAAEEEDAPILIVGSHLDTIPNAGKYDGILGVVLAIEAIDRLNEAGIKLPYHIEVVGFGDEEGVRFEASMLGSYAVSGVWDDEWFALQDAKGITLEQAFLDFGLEPSQVRKASRKDANLLGFWEVHIEQGPVLETKDLAVGVVSAIAGARRFKVSIEGLSGHAGTVPMNLREDALTGAAEILLMIEKLALQHQLVATVGHLQTYPGAVNVIPGLVEFTVDIRSESDALREKVMNLIFVSSEAISMQRGLDIYWKEYHLASAKQCHTDFRQLFESSITDQRIHASSLVSGAGHDAMNMAKITDIGMLFVRCKEGISHHPNESIEPEDAEIALETLLLSFTKLSECLKLEK